MKGIQLTALTSGLQSSIFGWQIEIFQDLTAFYHVEWKSQTDV